MSEDDANYSQISHSETDVILDTGQKGGNCFLMTSQKEIRQSLVNKRKVARSMLTRVKREKTVMC